MTDKSFMDRDLLDALRREGLDTVDGAFDYARGQDMTRAGLGHRQWIRLHLRTAAGQDHELYMKRYAREPLTWRLRRLWTYGPRKSPAGVEFLNVRGANQAALPTMQQAIYGEEFDFLGARRSYIIVTAVAGEALEQCARSFLDSHAQRPQVIVDFTGRLANLVASLHRAGYVHRDLYTSHIFLHQADNDCELRLIDLARMFRPRWRAFRWRVKDLAQLKYSMPSDWLREHWPGFLDSYVREVGGGELARLSRAVDRKVSAMRRKIDARKRRSERGKGPTR